jgi:hypothetical protein
MTRRILAMILLALLGRAAVVEANHTLATAYQGVLGERRTQTLAYLAAGYYRYLLTADRSYVAMCWPPLQELSVQPSGFCTIEFRNSADSVVGLYTGQSEPFPAGGGAYTFTPPANGQYFVRVLNNGGVQQDINFVVVETTLASPWFFVNAASGYETFAEIRNHAANGALVTVRAYDGAGALVGTKTFSMPPNGNAYVRVGADLGVSGIGSLTITHGGTPGAIVANATSLSAMSGLSFDAPFTPRMVWSTF